MTNISAGAISLTRSIQTEQEPGYDLYISVSDGRNMVAARSLSVRITGKFLDHCQFRIAGKFIDKFNSNHLYIDQSSP